MSARGFTRRSALGLAALFALRAAPARAFGGAGAFHPRLLTVGGQRVDPARAEAAARWAWELVRRTSAPARIVTTFVAPDQQELLTEPFVVWAGTGEIQPLARSEVRGLRQFLKLGGVMVVDDADPGAGTFSQSVKRELRRVLPESPVVKLDPSHVIFKTYYIIDRPVGRELGPTQVEAVVRGKNAQVLLLKHDLLGALARRQGAWALPVEPGGEQQRQYAIRLAVNLAMYVLCSDYKDDQVHAPWLMRRRARQHP
jgi:hypothetical protein